MVVVAKVGEDVQCRLRNFNLRVLGWVLKLFLVGGKDGVSLSVLIKWLELVNLRSLEWEVSA